GQLESAHNEPGSHKRFVVGSLELIGILEPRNKPSLKLDVVSEKVEVVGEAEISGRSTGHRRGMDLSRLRNCLFLMVTDGIVPPHDRVSLAEGLSDLGVAPITTQHRL